YGGGWGGLRRQVEDRRALAAEREPRQGDDVALAGPPLGQAPEVVGPATEAVAEDDERERALGRRGVLGGGGGLGEGLAGRLGGGLALGRVEDLDLDRPLGQLGLPARHGVGRAGLVDELQGAPPGGEGAVGGGDLDGRGLARRVAAGGLVVGAAGGGAGGEHQRDRRPGGAGHTKHGREPAIRETGRSCTTPTRRSPPSGRPWPGRWPRT